VRVEVWLPDATRVLSATCQSLQFQIGRGLVIDGVDIGVRGMRVAGTRVLVIAAERAYGERGVPGDVPPGATLVARVHLLDVSGGNFPNPNDCVRG
jgi:FKBP-type peptidyl-prolyl cis-trans isomerase